MGELVEKRDQQVEVVGESASVLNVIAKAATDPNVDIDKFERLMAMQERVMDREAQAAFDAAMADMQSEMPEITERGEIKVGNQVRSRYALFEDINAAVKPVLKAHGFAITFRVRTEGANVTVTGLLLHKEGHREETSITLPSDNSGSKNGVQALASSLSYAKRYVLSALLNISTRGEDDDGYLAGGPERITEQQAADLECALDEVKGDRAAFCRKFKINSLSDLSAQAYPEAMRLIERKRKQGGA